MVAIHFISGLPRSGSTLLAALLRQNPRFEAGMSGPLAGLFGALLGEMSARNEFSVSSTTPSASASCVGCSTTSMPTAPPR